MKIKARELIIRLGQHTVLDGVDLDVAPGITAIGGRNGAGKTTLLRVLAGILQPSSGSVSLDGKDLFALPPRTRARAVAFVPQGLDCPFEFTGRELVAMGRHPHLDRLASHGPADRTVVSAALEHVDATGFADRPVTTLSGGEQRRIALARALATEAPCLLLDEPTVNLDLEHALALCDLLRRLALDGRTVLLATHDINLFALRVDTMALIHRRTVHACGPAEEVLKDENLRAVFGVESCPRTGRFPLDVRRPQKGRPGNSPADSM